MPLPSTQAERTKPPLKNLPVQFATLTAAAVAVVAATAVAACTRLPNGARVVSVFRELREGQTENGKTKLKVPSSTLSTAEAVATHRAIAFGKLLGERILKFDA